MFSLFCNSHLLKGHQAIFRKICLSHLTFNFKEVELRQDFADKRNKLDSLEKISFKKKVRLQFEYALIALCYSFTYFFQSSVALCLVVVFYFRNTKKSVLSILVLLGFLESVQFDAAMMVLQISRPPLRSWWCTPE